MELIIVSPKKIKILLSVTDMEKYKLDIDNMDYNIDKTREAIKDILNIAKQKIGFDINGEKIFIQAFPGRDGGCELYISKLGNAEASQSKFTKKQINEKNIVNGKFVSLKELVNFCKRINGNEAMKNDIIYYDTYSQSYIISFQLSDGISFNTELTGAIIKEFNGTYSGKHFDYSSYSERYKCLCGVNAISLFCKLG